MENVEHTATIMLHPRNKKDQKTTKSSLSLSLSRAFNNYIYVLSIYINISMHQGVTFTARETNFINKVPYKTLYCSQPPLPFKQNKDSYTFSTSPEAINNVPIYLPLLLLLLHPPWFLCVRPRVPHWQADCDSFSFNVRRRIPGERSLSWK